MSRDNSNLLRNIASSAKRELADIVIKNGKIVDVFNQELLEGDVAITAGMIVGIGDYEGKIVIDARNKYIAPGFIDGHVHIESSMLTPVEYSHVVLPHGVTTVIADPHEIANVSGEDGLDYMISSSEDIALDVYYMLPSCVPAVSFENAGATLTAEQLEPYYKHQRVIGLGEVMNAPGVISGDPAVMDKLQSASAHNKHIDGHAAGLNKEAINVYMTAGIRTDHECTTPQEVRDRLQRGMYVMLREGSAARNLREIIKAVNAKNARRCLFVTDDKHLDDLVNEGSIDYNVRLAIEEGVDPILAIQMATLNAAECFGLKDRGAIAPGYIADILLLDSIKEISISHVYKSGLLVAHDSKYVGPVVHATDPIKKMMSSINIKPITKKSLELSIINATKQANIIGIIPNSIETKHLIEQVDLDDSLLFQPSIEKDQLKMVVAERHKALGTVGVAILKGLGITSGAIIATIAHDSHNIVAVGVNDEDILLGIDVIEQLKGGIVIVDDGKVLASVSLPIAGLMSNQKFEYVYEQLDNLNKALSDIGFKQNFNPFLTLSFLALPVIPELKLTDQGLFKVSDFTHINVDM
ncbi:MAG: adenine deaminase [Candidatus Pristimantibacillus lignocellulolyticus]|uniref:Adenine deaminase n=1 Tax=Candidatus Pristimantibacillus lignocellulolyticus TaxID=2994561 RepID=A0A9J6ZH95_9BACL|nr:MAG: adenine deaminase [Candidatus Pristimantibacillus lignocellulolyticus]